VANGLGDAAVAEGAGATPEGGEAAEEAAAIYAGLGDTESQANALYTVATAHLVAMSKKQRVCLIPSKEDTDFDDCKKVLIAAHGNSLRALVKYLDQIPEDKIVGLNIPTAVPLVYKLDRFMKPLALEGHADGLSGQYLGDPAWVDAKVHGVKNQAKR